MARTKASRVSYLHYSLNELFDEVELAEKMSLARRCIIAAFDHATELHRMKRKGTDNYIVGVGPKQRDLARHVMKCRGFRGFITPCDFPLGLQREMTKGQLNHIARRVEHDIVLATLNEMCRFDIREVQWDESRGIWQIPQTVRDEYRLSLQGARRALKFDRRNEHGMVRAQRINRGRPAGVSVSLASSNVV